MVVVFVDVSSATLDSTKVKEKLNNSALVATHPLELAAALV